jgi:SAM-dependent methyltransferase
MLDRARLRGIDAEFRQLDICVESPVEDSFDVVLCFNAFPHFRDKPAALCQIQRFLKPSGCLIVLHLAGSAKLNSFHSGLREPVCHDLLPGQHAWPSLLRDAGLCPSSFVDREDLFVLKAIRA